MDGAKVIKFKELQEKLKEKNRRKYQRVLFNNVLGAYAVIEEKGLLEVKLLDISQDGVRFALSSDHGKFKKGENLAFRLYFTQHDYIPIFIKVVHRQIEKRDGIEIVQYGCQLEVNQDIKKCMNYLVKFIQHYTNVAQNDHGDRQVYFL